MPRKLVDALSDVAVRSAKQPARQLRIARLRVVVPQAMDAVDAGLRRLRLRLETMRWSLHDIWTGIKLPALKARREDRRSDPRSAHHFAASRGEKPPLTRCRAVVELRHCQQAASNDARVYPALRLDKGRIGASASRRSCDQRCAGARRYRPARRCASAGDRRCRSSHVAMHRRVRVHRGLGELKRAPFWGRAVRFEIGRTQAAGHDRNACWLTDGAGQGGFTEEL